MTRPAALGTVDQPTRTALLSLEKRIKELEGNAYDGRRNLLDNGAMRVAQRGTSTASITTPQWVLDRWKVNVSALGTWTVSQEAAGPSNTGLASSMKVLCTTADASPSASDFFTVSQSIEGQNVQHLMKGSTAAEPLAVSWWAKSNKTGTYIVELVDLTNSRSVCAAYTIVTADTWERKTVVFPGDTSGALANSSAAALQVQFWFATGSNYTSGTLQSAWGSVTNANRNVGGTNLAAATNNYMQVTGVQLDAGAVTPFEFRPFDAELATCQRYLNVMMSVGGSALPFSGGNNSTTVVLAVCGFPVTMIGVPTLTVVGAAATFRVRENGAGPIACSVVPAISIADTSHALLTFTVAAGLTVGRSSLGGFNASTTSQLIFSAEI